MTERKGADLLDIHLLEQEARRRCDAAGVNVVFRDGMPSAAYDYKSHCVVLPTILPNHEFDETEYRRMLIHEVGHSNRKEVIKRAAGLDMSTPYGRLLNTVEDEVMERGIARTWYGDGVSLGLGNRRSIEWDTQMVHDMVVKGIEPDDKAAALSAAHVICQKARYWDNISKPEREHLHDILPSKIKKIVEELEDEGWHKRLEKTETCDQVFDYTRELYKRIFPEDKSEDPEKDARNGKADGAAGKGKPAPSKESGDGAPGKPGEEEAEAGTIHWTLLKPAEETFTGAAIGGGGKIDYRDYYYTPPGLKPTLCDTKVQEPRSHGRYSPMKVPDLPVAGQLRILLLSEGKAKIKTELTSGKLDKRKLARLAMPVCPGSDSWRKVFRRRIPAKKLNTAISILVDGSGSMAGAKTQMAAAAAAAVNHALTGPLRIPTEVNGFSHCGRDNIMVPVKGFNEKLPADEINKRCLGFPLSGNSDAESIMWATERLLKRKEKRKILLVLSDGMPADGTGKHNPGDMLTWAIKTCRNRGIEVYGIGILDGSVRKFYGKDCSVIRELHELAPALVTTLAGKLHR